MYGILSVGGNGEFGESSVDAVKGEGLDGLDDALDGRGVQRDVVGVAPHKADEAAVGNNLKDIAGE